MSKQGSNVSQHQLASVVSYLNAVEKELDISIPGNNKSTIANELLTHPYDLANVINKHLPDIHLNQLNAKPEVIGRPRPMQIPLKSNAISDSHISYFSFSVSPNMDDLELYFDKQHSKVLETIDASRLIQFLKKLAPTNITTSSITEDQKLWESTFEHEHASL